MADSKKALVAKAEYEINDFTMPEELVDAMVSIGIMTDDIVRAIPEDLFKQKYLPMFVSSESKVDMSPWLDICGTAYEPVNVTKGNRVLFVVPPLIKRHPTIINVDSRFSAPTIIAEAQQYQERHPALGVQHIIENLGKKVLNEGVDLEEVGQWNIILEYYGYPTIGNVKATGEVEVRIQPELDDNDFEEA